MLRANPSLRRLLGVWAQSCVGTGAGYVALLLLVSRHSRSSWAISAVLLAEFVPATMFGSWFGALADRYSKRVLLVIANVIQVGAFIAVAGTVQVPLIVGLALLAGIGNALQGPTMRSAVPAIAGDASQTAVALRDTLRWAGLTLGPLLAAGLLLVGGPALPLIINGASFAIAAIVIATIRIESPSMVGAAGGARARGIIDGLRDAFQTNAIRWMVACSAGSVIGGGLLNVCEPRYATRVLHGSGSDYGALVACYGIGMVAATALVAHRGVTPLQQLAKRYITALALTAAGMAGSAIVGSVPLAAWTFAATGFANGLLVVTEAQIILGLVAHQVQGRLFGAKTAVEGAFFLMGLVAAGALIAATGVRATLAEGAAVCGVCAIAALIGLKGLRTAADSQAPVETETALPLLTLTHGPQQPPPQ